MNDNTVQELTLLLIYLTGWEEDKMVGVPHKRKSPGEKIFRAWKGYKFETLDDLQSEKLIWQIPGGKSLFLTDEGKRKVEELKSNFLD